MSDLSRGFIERILAKYNFRFPTLFAIFAALTLFDIVVPDVIPFVDEIGLALLTMIFGMWRRRGTPSPQPPQPR